jgi:hypothetical protein
LRLITYVEYVVWSVGVSSVGCRVQGWGRRACGSECRV